MAADYWSSTQRRHWLFTRERLAEIRESLREKDKQPLPCQLPDPRHLNIYFNQQLLKISSRQSIRQQAIATAQVYIKRYYTKVDMLQTNPYLVLATALYLACKMEECPQHIRYIHNEVRYHYPDLCNIDTAKIGECEFSLIAEMNSQLIVHHPYRTLMDLQPKLGLKPDEMALAWSIINDHYLTDLPLLYPPHVIAVTAIFIAVVFKSGQSNYHGPFLGQTTTGALRDGSLSSLLSMHMDDRHRDLVNWLAESEVDIKAMIECTQELVSLYEVWDQYNDKYCREQLTRLIRCRNLEKG
ncbi:hypothetical protein VTN49DRAFT_1003 [Thermomyces lanuginosus]|uniref:uncharacterized protein n=1 Tax=Thermomyces lanuginosus TaxID=5541 RepID=UPI003741FB31